MAAVSDKIVSLASAPKGNKADADELRAIADLVETGEVRDALIVYNNLTEKCYARFGVWEDRWRLLGALEYAKGGLLQRDDDDR